MNIDKSSYKPDFGLHLKKQYSITDSNIIITDPFFINNLVLYPNQNSAITGTINDMVVTFDFDDSILKVFFWVLRNLNLINRQEIDNRIRDQQFDPVIIRFDSKKVLVTGMVLSCHFGQLDNSQTTDENFQPLIIDSAKIIKEPAAAIIEPNS
jgi:hypothetical protein